MVAIDIRPLENALKALRAFIEHTEKLKAQGIERRMHYAASIKAFEFTYAVSVKMVTRFLKMTEADAHIDNSSLNELIRLACRRGLVRGEVAEWNNYREHRNASSHNYDEKTAEEIYAVAKDFLEEAAYIAQALKERIDAP